jgi:response regulator RpfG family c-di-GMP phosphodiesterase/serine/threonine protein kinase
MPFPPVRQPLSGFDPPPAEPPRPHLSPDSLQSRLNRLVEQWVVLPEEWDELPAPIRDEILHLRPGEDFLDKLVENQLLTEFQADSVRGGTEGSIVLGHYRLLEPIGHGGMGTVYRAEHLHLRRLVALKLMNRSVESNSRLLHRFYAEARAVARLQHPNIVACTDAGRHLSPGYPPRDYFVMELIAGQDLFSLAGSGDPLPVGRVCDLFRQIADALAEAHRLGLVHRDIKPSNILVTPDWQAKLLDFGLALQPQNRMTEPGTLLGTVGYMAPEQARDPHSVDARADLFSVGATMYWALTGCDPYPETGNILQDLTARMTAGPADVRRVRPELPEEVVALIAKLTDPDPDRRYPSARALAAALAGMGRWATRVVDAEGSQAGVPRVLVAEDDPRLRKLVTSLLRDCSCVEAPDGHVAWAELERAPFDLVVLDVNMPGLSGPEVIAKVRSDAGLRERPKILVMSGELTSESFGGLLMSGADDYLAKPFNPPEFQARARALLGRRVAPPAAADSDSQPTVITKPAARGSEVAPITPLALGVTRLLEELGVAAPGYYRRAARYVRALAVAAPDHGEYARLKEAAYLEMLAGVAAIHDAGMIAIPQAILLKPKRLDPEDLVVVQQHPLIGGQVLADVAARLPEPVPELATAEEVVRFHHERWDGGGYPDGLAGDQIPLSARVVAITSVYEALRMRRPHRPAFNRNQAVRLITQESVGQFDPALVTAFSSAAVAFDEIFRSSEG